MEVTRRFLRLGVLPTGTAGQEAVTAFKVSLEQLTGKPQDTDAKDRLTDQSSRTSVSSHRHEAAAESPTGVKHNCPPA